MGWKECLVGGGLVAAVLLCYIPATRGQFIWDDDKYVSENPALLGQGGLRGIWLQPGATPQYYPLVFTSFWLEARFWRQRLDLPVSAEWTSGAATIAPETAVRLSPRGFHWVNVLLHGINAFLLWLILRRLGVPGALFAAALFALHPVQVESVAWITERKNVLSGFFYGLALLAYLNFAMPDPVAPAKRGSWHWYVLALVLFICALLSKTVACSLPAAFVLILWWKRGRVSRSEWLALVLFFVVGLALSWVTVWVEKNHVNAQGSEWNFSILDRCLIAGRALCFYSGKLLWPIDLTFIYPRWSIDPHIAWQYLFPLGAITLVVFLWLARKRLGRGPLVAVLFFAGTLVPALGFINVYPMRFSFVADHFQYLASAGLLTLAAAAGTTLVRRLAPNNPWPGAGTAGIVLIVLGTLTWRQGYPYRDQMALWNDTLAKNPGCWIAHSNLARLLFARGDLGDAERHYRQAIELYPAAWEAQFGLALVQQRLGDPVADEHFAAAYALHPDSVEAATEAGRILIQKGHAEQAIEPLTKAVERGPRYALAHYHLGAAWLHIGKSVEAVSELQRAAELSPNTAAIRYALGIALFHDGQQVAADAEFRSARQDARWPAAARQAAWTLATNPNPRVRNGPLAVRLIQEACDASQFPAPELMDTLAAAQAESGKFEEAAKTARRALEYKASLPPDLARQMDDRLHLYERKQPYHEKPRS